MKPLLIFPIILFLTFVIFGCSKDNTNSKPISGILKIEDALENPNAAFVNLVNEVRGSVGVLGPGSKVVCSRKNDYNLGLYIFTTKFSKTNN